MVFSKKRESQAMSNEVKTNIVLSIVLLATVALIVFFVGKKGFTSYRGKQYEIAQNEVKPKEAKKELGITADMLTNKKGKITGDKLEQLAAVTSATAKATDATVHAASVDREAYDATTAQMTDIVGASAFVLELLLALLAYSIATAKFAAVYDEIARRNGSSRPTSQQAQQSTAQQTVTTTAQAASNTATNTPSVTAQAASQQAAQTATTTEPNQQAATQTNEKKGITQRFNEYTVNDQNAITEKLKQDLERDMFYFSVEQIKAYLSRVNGIVTIVSDATTQTIKFHSPIVTDEITTATTNESTTYRNDISLPDATPRKKIGFSDNKKENDGRVIIKGFQRNNEEKQHVNEVVTTYRNDISLQESQDETTGDKKIGVCPTCGKKFEKKNYRHTFDSEECRAIAWTAKTGKKFKKSVKA